MPVNRVTKQGKPGYRYGKTGATYTYKSGNSKSRGRAYRRAMKQGWAIKARKRGK